MPCSDFRYPTIALCLSRPQASMTCCQSAIECPYFFSIDGKYEAGPCLGHGADSSGMLSFLSNHLSRNPRVACGPDGRGRGRGADEVKQKERQSGTGPEPVLVTEIRVEPKGRLHVVPARDLQVH